MGRISCPHPKYGYSRCTLGPADCVAASHTLRNEGERPTGYTEAMAAAVARRGRAHGAWRAISVANIDRKVTYFHLEIKGSIYLGNPMETCKKVTGLWTVTRNGPDILPSSNCGHVIIMHIRTCWLRRGPSHVAASSWYFSEIVLQSFSSAKYSLRKNSFFPK